MAARAWILLMCTVLTVKGSKAQSVNGCGTAPLNNKIVGGDDATAGSWPWQVSLHFSESGRHVCGGTLINNQWVLTAAHCILASTPSEWTLYLGRQTQAGPNANEVMSSVSQIIQHPDYNNTLFNNDLALMKLSSTVTFNNYIRPICLASSSSQFHNSTLCWATGWGRLNIGEILPETFSLQEVQIPVIGNNLCSCNYLIEPAANITETMICAGQENKGTCQGDSGGPLQCKQGSVWVQAGISSFGVPCARAGTPEVFARVSKFEKWITDNIAGTNADFVRFSSNGVDPDSSFVCPQTTATASAASVTHGLVFSVILVTLFLQLMVS